MRRCNIIRGMGNNPVMEFESTDIPPASRGGRYPTVDPTTGIRYRVLGDGTCLRDPGMLQVVPVPQPCPPGIASRPRDDKGPSTNARAFATLPWLAVALLVALLVR